MRREDEFRRFTVGRGYEGNSRNRIWVMVIAVCALLFTACSGVGKEKLAEATAMPRKTEKVQEQPKPSDVKLINGVEYIYGRNRRWPTVQGEPEYVWIRKDQDSPGLLESLKQPSATEEKEREDLKRRIERLEAELKKLDATAR